MAEILTEQAEGLKTQPPPQGHTPETPGGTPGDTKGGKQHGREAKPKLPKGVVLDKDGKPCRTCTSASEWRALTRMTAASSPSPAGSSSSSTSTASNTANSSFATAMASALGPKSSSSPSTSAIPADCPPDVEVLGRSTWTLLHSMAASYPETASYQQQNEMRSFLSLFSKLYPCWVCADDFRAWMNKPNGVNQPKLRGRGELGNWMCQAHNEVNRKLGKKEFDCSKWEERWRTGWKDGRCD